AMPASPGNDIRALVFDVFGTCVDWRGSVIREGQRIGAAKGLSVDWPVFADQWRREGYIAGIAPIPPAQTPSVGTDVLVAPMLHELLVRPGITALSPDEVKKFAHAWRRLDPWPDTVEGLTLLKRRFVVSPLSNGSFATLTEMARYGGLPWDCIISTE